MVRTCNPRTQKAEAGDGGKSSELKSSLNLNLFSTKQNEEEGDRDYLCLQGMMQGDHEEPWTDFRNTQKNL